MISVTEALAILSAHVPVTPSELAGLDDALGRICAQDILAKVTLPPRDASAMDGYAVRLEDVRSSRVSLKVIGEVPAGSEFGAVVGKGETVRVFTGSPVPKGADHIIIQENTIRSGSSVKVLTRSHASRHIRRAGLDFAKGDVIVPRLAKFGLAEIALAAAGNHSDVLVFKKPHISILAAGDELVLPGAASSNGDVVNSNTSALTALIKTWGGTAIDMGLAKDDPSPIEAMFERAKTADILLPVGGASVGDYDHMRSVFKKMGGQIIFEKIAVKPGKPTWFGILDGKPVLGLPGNPASALVCAHLFLRCLMGSPPAAVVKMRLEGGLPENGPRETYLRARASSRAGQLYVQPFPRQDSSLLTPFRDANVLLRRLPNADPATETDLVDVIELGSGPSAMGE